MKTRPIKLLVVALAACASLAPTLTHAAGDCASGILLYSWNSADEARASSIYTSQLQCILDPERTAGDGHFIHPLSDMVSVGYSGTRAVTPTLTAYLDGLGFDHTAVTLDRGDEVVPGTGVYIYLSDAVEIPDGMLATGCVGVTIDDPDDAGTALDYNEFHTVDSSCP